MLIYIKKLSLVVLLFFILHMSAYAFSLDIKKEGVKSIKIYTLYPYPEHIKGAVPLNLTINTRDSIDEFINNLNAMNLSKPEKNGDGGTGTSYFIEIKRDNGEVEKYTQYAYDFYMGDLEENDDAESYGIENNFFMEFHESTLYKTNTTPSDWAKEDVLNAAELQVIPRAVTGNYKQYLTREQFCDLVVNALYKSDKMVKLSDITVKKDVFKDTDNLSVSILYKYGMVKGKTDNEFDPDGYISYEEAMTILGRIIKKFNINVPFVELAPDYAKDISGWAQEYIGQVLPLCIDNTNVANNDFKTPIITEVAISMVMQLFYRIS